MNPIKPQTPAPIEPRRVARAEEMRGDEVGKSAASNVASENLSSADAIEISSQAEAANVLVARAKSAPDVRLDKIAGLKERIQSGSYQPSAQEIAEAMIEDSKQESVVRSQ